MDEKCHENSIEFRDYIKNRRKLGHRTKSIYNEMANIYGDNALKYRIVFRSAKTFCNGREPLENIPR